LHRHFRVAQYKYYCSTPFGVFVRLPQDSW
jgi:hypothetical protein